MQVRDGMSEVSLTVGPSHTLREAAAKMVEKGTGAALVIDAESPTPVDRYRARPADLRRRAARTPTSSGSATT